jgi:Tol biopolymer transport system component
LKALEKDRDLRCQTAAELRADLKRLQRDTTAGRRTDAGADSDRQPAVASNSSMSITAPTSSGAVLIAEARRHKVGVAVSAAALLVLVAAAGFGVYRAITGDRSSADTAERLRITPLTTSGDVRGCTSISPDGRYVVYCETDRATRAAVLRIRQVATGATVKLADGGGTTTFSPDGNFVFVVRDNAVFVVPAIGGEEPQRLTPPGMRATAVAVSPDGQQIAFVRRSILESSIIIAPREGSSERKLYGVASADGLIGVAPAWSPDGTVIAAGYRDGPPGELSAPAVVDAASGTLRRFTQPRWGTVHRLLWLHDGSGLVVSAVQPGEIHNQLWLVSYPGGEVKRITNDLHDYATTSIGLSRDDTIAVAQYTDAGDIWVSDPSGANPTSVTGGSTFNTVLGWTDDNQLVFRSEKPVRSLWTASPKGGTPRRVPIDLKDVATTLMSAGQNWIAYTNVGSTPGMWRVNLDGSGRRQLTQSFRHANPRPTPDGAWIVYADWESKQPATWKLAAGGGQPVLLTERVGHPVPSPDSQRYWAIILTDRPTADEPQSGIGIFRLSDGTLEKTINPGRIGAFVQNGRPQWAPDGQSLVFIRTSDENVSNLWTLPLDGTEPRQLTQFERDRIFSYAFSPDGRMLATSRGHIRGDIVLLRNFR